MSKDPAFLFYSADFLIGIEDFTNEQVGMYIRLLCRQHLKGHIEEKHMLKICKTYDKDIFEKFKKDTEGKFYNKRLEYEIERRKKYSESRSKNRNSKKNEDIKDNDNDNNISNSYVTHMENENENENKATNKNDPFINSNKTEFEKEYKKIFGSKPYLSRSDCLNLDNLICGIDNFFEILPEGLKKLSNLDFDSIDFKPTATWFLVEKNFTSLMNGAYDKKIQKKSSEIKAGKKSLAEQAQELKKKGL